MATQTTIHKPTALTSNDWLVEPIDDRSQMGYAYAPTNIALTKYWGKRDVVLNLPTKLESISRDCRTRVVHYGGI